MANPVWSLTNKTIDNRGTRVNPALNTVTSANPQGWTQIANYTLFGVGPDPNYQYRINQGKVEYKIDGNQYSNLQQYADSLSGTRSTQAIQNTINTLKRNTAESLSQRTQDIIPSQPAPASPTKGAAPTSTPGSAAAGPNSDPDPDLSSFNTVLGILQDQPGVEGNYGKLYYPENIGKTNQDRVFIQMLKYVLPDISQSGSAFAGALSNRENDFVTKTKILGSVTLPITNNLTESVEVGWGEDRLSSIAAGLMAGGVQVVKQAAGGSVIGALRTLGGTAGGVLGNTGIAERANQYITAKAAAGVISGIGFQINPESYITRRTGTVPNPNLELLFNGPKLKAFGLVFRLTPRSETEAHQIRNIIKFFKKGMAPIRGNNQENSFFLGAPNVFKIQFKPSDSSSELLSLPQFKTCALVRCEVGYTPDGFYAAYQDSRVTSQPVSVTLQLGFSELTPVYNSDYDFPGNNNESVGPDRNLFNQALDLQQSSLQQKASNLTQQEAQRQSSRPENVGRSIEQIQSDPGARRLEYQNILKKLSNKNLSPTERSQLQIRAQQLSGRT